MKLFKKKRTIDADLACLFHKEFHPEWLTEENIDQIPTCTTCHLSLVPVSYKRVLIDGEMPPNLKLSPSVALTAACSAMTTLWAHIGLGPSPIGVAMQAVDDVWAPEAYKEWPNIGQGALAATVGDGATLGSQELGTLTEQLPYLALVVVNLQWHLEDRNDSVTVHLWPKDSMAVLSQFNYKAFQEYLASVRRVIPEQKIWIFIDKLSALLERDKEQILSQRLVGVEVTLQTLIESHLKPEWELEEDSHNSSTEPLQIEAGESIEPLGPDSPKRLYQKYFPRLEMAGPFDLEVIVHSSYCDEYKLELIHEYRFKLFVRAASSSQALILVKSKFFQKFGLTVMQRQGMNWRLEEDMGIDWNQPTTIHDTWMNSRIVDVKHLSFRELGETAWQSRCI